MIRWTASLVTPFRSRERELVANCFAGLAARRRRHRRRGGGQPGAVHRGRPDRALAEIGRVLRPGGGLRFYEHARATDPLLARSHVLGVAEWEP